MINTLVEQAEIIGLNKKETIGLAVLLPGLLLIKDDHNQDNTLNIQRINSFVDCLPIDFDNLPDYLNEWNNSRTGEVFRDIFSSFLRDNEFWIYEKIHGDKIYFHNINNKTLPYLEKENLFEIHNLIHKSLSLLSEGVSREIDKAYVQGLFFWSTIGNLMQESANYLSIIKETNPPFLQFFQNLFYYDEDYIKQTSSMQKILGEFIRGLPEQQIQILWGLSSRICFKNNEFRENIENLDGGLFIQQAFMQWDVMNFQNPDTIKIYADFVQDQLSQAKLNGWEANENGIYNYVKERFGFEIKHAQDDSEKIDRLNWQCCALLGVTVLGTLKHEYNGEYTLQTKSADFSEINPSVDYWLTKIQKDKFIKTNSVFKGVFNEPYQVIVYDEEGINDFCFKDEIGKIHEKGNGILITTKDNETILFIKFGDICDYILTGELVDREPGVNGWGQGEIDGEEFKSADFSDPGENILTIVSRKMIKEFLIDNGINEPKVSLITFKDGSRSITFNFNDKYKDEEHILLYFQKAIHSLMPRNYTMLLLPDFCAIYEL